MTFLEPYYPYIIGGLFINLIASLTFIFVTLIRIMLLIKNPLDTLRIQKLNIKLQNDKPCSKYWFTLFIPFAKLLEFYLMIQEEIKWSENNRGDFIDYLYYKIDNEICN